MGGSASAREFVDSVERECRRRLLGMRIVYSVDPTPALKERIERTAASDERRLKVLRQEHERFERLMELSDDELRAIGSGERGERLFGNPALVDRIAKRKMGEAEYLDLLFGPDVPAKEAKP